MIDNFISSFKITDPPNSNGPGGLTSPSSIANIISKLGNKKSPGSDRITVPMLKNCSRKALTQIYYIFSCSLRLSYFPMAWKVAQVSAIPKPNKPRTSTSSYRPISLLSIIGKVFEALINNILNNFLEKNETLINQQFGFRRRHSTIHQVIRIAQHITHELNTKRHAAMVLLDLAKAFDSVWHDALIYKLYQIGLDLGLVKLIHSYLTSRTFFVRLNGALSSTKKITSGVPQGSVLGPTLFNIFINDIPRIPGFFLALYADDTALLATSKNPTLLITKLQSTLNTTLEYFRAWKLTINPEKTEAIFFTRTRCRPQHELSVMGHNVPWQKKVKYLGVILDQRMSWLPAVDDRIAKFHKAYSVEHRHLLPSSPLYTQIRILIYKMCLRPVLTYGSTIWWDILSHSYKRKLQIAQNKALKTILGLTIRYPTLGLHEMARVPLISDHIKKQINNFTIDNHPNKLIRELSSYNIHTIPYRIKVPFPLVARFSIENLNH